MATPTFTLEDFHLLETEIQQQIDNDPSYIEGLNEMFKYPGFDPKALLAHLDRLATQKGVEQVTAQEEPAGHGHPGNDERFKHPEDQIKRLTIANSTSEQLYQDVWPDFKESQVAHRCNSRENRKLLR